jgi:hypothetical protein
VAFIHVIEDESSTLLAELVTTHDCYELPDRSQCFISTDAAWCHRCGQFTLVEKIVAPDEMEASAREFYEHRERNPLLPPDMFPTDQTHGVNLSVLNGLLHVAAQWRLALATRTSPPRCLECGGVEFVALPETDDWSVHPADPAKRVRGRINCHASMCEPGRLYDTEGRRIPGRLARWDRGRPE